LETLSGIGVLEDEHGDNAEHTPTADESAYMADKVSRIFACAPELDEKINQVAEGWKTKRMSRVDLTIIRLALYEILYDDQVPEKVAINEAVELAKKYGGDESSSFINGVLAKLVRK
jgi:N utilization substance protein B